MRHRAAGRGRARRPPPGPGRNRRRPRPGRRGRPGRTGRHRRYARRPARRPGRAGGRRRRPRRRRSRRPRRKRPRPRRRRPRTRRPGRRLHRPAARHPGPGRHLARPRRARRTATRPRTRPPAPPGSPAQHRRQRQRRQRARSPRHHPASLPQEHRRRPALTPCPRPPTCHRKDHAMSSLTDPLGPDLTATLRALKLGKLTATLPERLTLARQTDMPHADFLQLILSDEVARREAGSIALRARNAGLDPAMRTETWDPAAAIRYDQRLWNELVSLRFLDGPHGALILGPVGVGKTHLATALGHIAVRRRRTVHMARADKLFKRLTAARLDNTLDYEYRRLTTVELLIIDDFALQPLTPAQTTDFYEIITERHRKASTVVTSNRDTSEWLPLMTDPLLAQSAIDRLTSTCHELIVEGDSYRRRQRPAPPRVDDPAPATP